MSHPSALLPQQRQLLRTLTGQHRAGYGLTRPFYHDAELYQLEMQLIWRRQWLFAGHTAQAPQPGDYFVFEFDGDSIIIARQDDGTLAAFHNVCRHRGSLIVDHAAGHAEVFVCPYHQWVYDTDGRLLQCRHMSVEINKAALGLRPVHIRNLNGLIYICLADSPPDFTAAAALIGPMAAPQGFERAKIAQSIEYDIHANWKLIWEHNRECYHCDANHPQYV